MSPIESMPPEGWRDLQVRIHRILTECGMKAEIERRIELARGIVEIDVFAEDPGSTPPATYVCECKNWATAIPQGVVHGFRTVVLESGANLGMIIARTGFQSGAHAAAAYSNIRLMTWEEFQRMFCSRWFNCYMAPLLNREVAPLESRLFPKGYAPYLDSQSLKELRDRWAAPATIPWRWREPFGSTDVPVLPLRQEIESRMAKGALYDAVPKEVFDATSLRDLLDVLVNTYRAAVQEFDRALGRA